MSVAGEYPTGWGLADEGVGALAEAGLRELPRGLGHDVVEADHHLHGDDPGQPLTAEDVYLGVEQDLEVERNLLLEHGGQLVHELDRLLVMLRVDPKPKVGAGHGLVKPVLEPFHEESFL